MIIRPRPKGLTFIVLQGFALLDGFVCVIRYSDPTKVVVGERNVGDEEAKLFVSTKGRTERSTEKGDDVLEETIATDVSEIVVEKTKKKRKSKAVGDASGSTHPPKRLREDFHARTSDIGEKSLVVLRGLVPEDSSVSELNLQARPIVARSSVADVAVVIAVATTTIAVDVSVVPPPQFRVVSGRSTSVSEAKKNVASTSKLDEPTTSSDSFYAAAADVSWGKEKDAEIAHLRSLLSLKESEAAEAIRLREQVSVVEAAAAVKGDELRDLKERNFVLEREKDLLSERVTTLESVTALKETEVASLTAQVTQLTSDLSGSQFSCDELNSKVVSLESERDGLVNQISSLESAFEFFKQQMEARQDKQAITLLNRVMELDAQLLEMAVHIKEEFYPRFLVTISGRRWILTHGLKLVILKCLKSSEYCHALGQAIGCAINKGIQDSLKAGVDHRKAGRDLSVIETYDPFAESKYIDAVNALSIVDFYLLTELESKKDASMADLIDSLRLEGPLAEIPGAEDLQTSLEQLMLLIHRMEENVLLEETSISFSLQVIC
ncbi:hypothetical protein Tco_0260316 [Tanacetum coccineum]